MSESDNLDVSIVINNNARRKTNIVQDNNNKEEEEYMYEYVEEEEEEEEEFPEEEEKNKTNSNSKPKGKDNPSGSPIEEVTNTEDDRNLKNSTNQDNNDGDSVNIPEIDLDSIDFDSDGNLNITINEEDILNSIGEVELTKKEKEEIKRQVEEEFGHDQTDNQIGDHETRKRLISQQIEQLNQIQDLLNILTRQDQNAQEQKKTDEILGKFDSIIKYYDQSKQKLPEVEKNYNEELLSGIEKIYDLYVNIHELLEKYGIPKMTKTDIKSKTIEEIRAILNKMIEEVKEATKNIKKI